MSQSEDHKRKGGRCLNKWKNDLDIYQNNNMDSEDLGFIGTIGDEDDINVVSESSESDLEAPVKKQKKKKKNSKISVNHADEFDINFEFEDQDDAFESWGLDAILESGPKSRPTTIDDKIAQIRRLRKKKDKLEDDQAESEDEQEPEEEDWTSPEEEDVKIDKIKIKEKKKKKTKKKKGQEEEEPEKMEYASEISDYNTAASFQDINLSRPLQKSLTTMSFLKPTPIQAATIPIALLGKDICACAATGTGKTAAFMLPILERLMYRTKQAHVTRVLVLTPTRELAVQIYQVSRQLAQFTNIEISLSAGGLDIKAQEAALRLGPDVVIATPGRLIDHLHNSPNFNLNSVEILVLDEADRMLDEYFAEQMKEVIRLCSRTRQTMLFSATMTEEVQNLAAVSLKEPVRVFVNQNTEVAFNLRQEFVRIRPSREGDREAIIAALVKRTFHDHCMVFIQTKKQAHRMHILLGLLGIKVGELHGNLSQPQRLEALKRFKEAELDVLLATDLAARGLDIHGVKTVINFNMPGSVQHYIHRVGRTARAGKAGRSVTLVGEKGRKMLKEIVKKAKNPVKSRVIPQEVIQKFRERISTLEADVREVEEQEGQERELRAVENKVNKAQKMIDDNADRKRNWFQTHHERQQEQVSLRLGDLTKLPNSKQKRKEILASTRLHNADERAEFEIEKAAAYSVRAAKKQHREKRKRAVVENIEAPVMKKKKKVSSFEKELTTTSGRAMKQLRAGPSYQEKKQLGLLGKKGAKFGKKGKRR